MSRLHFTSPKLTSSHSSHLPPPHPFTPPPIALLACVLRRHSLSLRFSFTRVFTHRLASSNTRVPAIPTMNETPVTPAPNRLDIDVNDYTATQRRPPHIWTSGQRVVLAWLGSYENPFKDITILFNAAFKNELGNNGPLSIGAITSMWYCMELDSKEQDALRLLHASSYSLPGGSFGKDTRSFLEGIASSLGVILRKRSPDSKPRPTKATRSPNSNLKKRKAAVQDHSSHDTFPTITSVRDNSNIPSQTPTGQINNASPPRHYQSDEPGIQFGLPSPPPTFQRASKKLKTSFQNSPDSPLTQRISKYSNPEQLPELAFRAFSLSSFTSFTSSGLYVQTRFPLYLVDLD